MNAQANPSLNGGSGGLAGGPQNITLGAGGLKTPADQRERLRRIIFVIVILAAVNTVVAEGDRNI